VINYIGGGNVELAESGSVIMKTRQPRGTRAAAVRERLSAWETGIGAFVTLDETGFARLDAADGPLSGLAVGVKDVLDVAGLPTRNGSRTCNDAAPAINDAPVVAALRAAGAAILGKTVTTEFAFIDPTDCRNPFDTARTPGGSSSGSGAAVGAGALDLALGTQTAGSLCRPAAYCGAVGLKPGHGVLSTVGMTPLAPSFDAPGFIARDVSTAAAAFGVCTGSSPLPDLPAGLRLGLAPIDPDAPMSASALTALDGAEAALSALGMTAKPGKTGLSFAAIVADHRTVMLAEAASAHGSLLGSARDRLRPRFAAALAEGRELPQAEVTAARAHIASARTRFWDEMSGFDLLLAPPVPDGAPRLDQGTGYQNLLTPWTVFAGPLLALPWGLDALGRPRSVMLAAAPGREALVLAAASALERFAPVLPRPTAPAGIPARQEG
jgi:Asp-tRNA(Asn)/Glu-tRNA(Gln) amidotransferase A subunit family amidase